jgi:hypothetical protein
MNYDDRSVILAFGLLGSSTFFIGFLSAIMVNIRYALISTLGGSVLGGLAFFVSSHLTFSYMIGGITTLVIGVSFSVYYWTVKFELLNYFNPEHQTRSNRMNSKKKEEIARVSGSWK